MKKTVFWRRTAALLAALLLIQPVALAAYQTLEYGMRGAEVRQLQQALLSLGFDPNGADGKFGSGTRSAVKAYQRSRGLVVDGKAGNLTLALLYSEVDGSASSGSTGSAPSESAATKPSTLKYGSTGSEVQKMQTALKKLGYLSGSADGKFGAATKQAVVKFQSANKLTPDGLAGTKTLTLLYAKADSADNSASDNSSSSSSSANGFTRTLRRGYTGDDVVRVQNRLKELGYYAKSVDGVYGLGSMAAVKAFQQRNNLSDDGLVGARTYEVLFSNSALANGSTPPAQEPEKEETGSAYETLRQGDEGDAVRTMQRSLKNLNYPLTVDGSFGPTTFAAVKLFQSANNLTADGVAGHTTLSLLYSGSAKAYTEPESSGSSSSSGGSVASNAGASAMGSFTGANGKTIRLLHWFDEVKPSLKTGQNLSVYEPSSGISFTLYVMSRGRHADVEPLTADDTAKMMDAWGGKEDWTPKTVYIGLPDGRWTMATMHNVAHGSQVINDNNFNGQNCVHFLRNMSEAEANDPNYGVQNQEALRKSWKNKTGVNVK